MPFIDGEFHVASTDGEGLRCEIFQTSHVFLGSILNSTLGDFQRPPPDIFQLLYLISAYLQLRYLIF